MQLFNLCCYQIVLIIFFKDPPNLLFHFLSLHLFLSTKPCNHDTRNSQRQHKLCWFQYGRKHSQCMVNMQLMQKLVQWVLIPILMTFCFGIMPNFRCSKQTDNSECRKKILSGCVKMLSDTFTITPEKKITADCDAFSFLIVADKMEAYVREAIKKFLYCFGSSLSSISLPSVAIGAVNKDSIFGSTRSKGCQHLLSTNIGNKFMCEESLVISGPVKIAVHSSCRKHIISNVCEYPQQYPMEMSSNIDICFDPSNAANKPPYGVVIDAILDSCFVSGINKYVLHVADIGTRHKMEYDGDGQCPIQKMFHKVNKIRDIQGVSVEIMQVDIAFNIPTTKNDLIQCSYEQISERGRNRTFVDSMLPETWALHSIHTQNDRVDRKQKGSVRLRQTEWTKSSKIKLPLFLEESKTEDNGNSSDSSFIPTQGQTRNVLLSQVYHPSSICNTSPYHIEIDANTIYSIKFYSTISHYLTQRRNQLPLTFKQMNDLPQSSMIHLQRFSNLMLKLCGGAMKFVHNNGICARLEVSVRPNGGSTIGNVIRCHGHLTDILAHVQIAIHELIISGNHKLTLNTIHSELVYSKILFLIDQLQSMTRFRAAVRFCDIYCGNRCYDWLRAVVNAIMTFTGLGGQTKLKYVAKWLHDESRYNPTNQPPKNLIDLHANINTPTPLKPIIPDKFWNILNRCLRDNHFSKTCISSIIRVIKMDKPLSHSGMLLQETSLHEKWHIAKNLCQAVVPFLLKYLRNNDKDPSNNPSIVAQSSSTNHILDDIGDNVQNFLCNPSFDAESYFPQQLVNSSLALNQFQDHAVIPKRKPKLLTSFPQDPMVMMIMKLLELSLLFDIHTPVYVKYLYQHIRLCHFREITLPNCDMKLIPLDCIEGALEFHQASLCLNENRCDRASLHMICTGLGVPIIVGHVINNNCDNESISDSPSAETLIASLCWQYYFPCKLMSTFPHYNMQSISPDDQVKMNSLICETFKSEIVVELPSHLKTKRHFYNFFQDNHIWIYKKITCHHNPSLFISTTDKIIDESDDLYVILDKCFNKNGTQHGDDMRANLHFCLKGKSMDAPIHSFFLNNNGTSNTNFCQLNTLSELQSEKKFLLLEHEDTPMGDRSFSNMCPDIIVPCTSLLYESSIFLIDKGENKSYLHLFDKNSSKVVTYAYSNADSLPPTRLKCYIFIKDGTKFSFIQFKSSKLSSSIVVQNHNTRWPFNLDNAEKLYSYSQHPHGRVCPAKSITESLKKLLTSPNVNHEQFRTNLNKNDPLDVLHYLNEFNTSCSHLQLNFIFCGTIVSRMKNIGIESLTYLVSMIQESDYTNLPHTVICPILCLKYKLWIAVWEEESAEKKTFFYCYDSRHERVACQVIEHHYAYLPCQSHILYIKSSKSKSFGYWHQDKLNPFTHPEFQYNFAIMLTCKFSYLDDPLKNKVLTWFREKLCMIIVHEYEISNNNQKNRFLFHDGKKPTLVPIQLLNKNGFILQHCLLVFYPFDEKKQTYFGLFVHTQLPRELVNGKRTEILELLKDEYLPSKYSLEGISIHQRSDFATSFYQIVHMYIAQMSKDVNEFKQNLSKLSQESDLVSKSKNWIASLISDPVKDGCLQSFIPQWLLQIAFSEETFQDSTKNGDHKRKNPMAQYDQLSSNDRSKNSQEFHQTKNKKRKESIAAHLHVSNLSTHSTQLPPSSSNKRKRLHNVANHTVTNHMSRYSSASILNIFGHSGNFNDNDFKKFVEHISRLTKEQTKMSKILVAKAQNKSICADEFESLIESGWLSDTIIDFMGMILKKNNQDVHVFTTHFMAKLIPDNTMKSFNYSEVSRWHKKIHVKVKFLYVPIHHHQNHWILCRVDFSKKEIYLWNSSSSITQNMIYLEAMKNYIQLVAKSVNELSNNDVKENTMIVNQWNGNWIIDDRSMLSPQQGNYDDCGIFTILNMSLLMSGVELSEYSYSQFEINARNTRRRIAQIIFKNIAWNDFVSNNIQDKKWMSFINDMKSKLSPSSWKWVNQTISH